MELQKFGIKTRSKTNDTDSPVESGSRIHLIRHDSLNSRGNSYLKRQYMRLRTYRRKGDIVKYWQTG
jgi:hypothetical protein